MVADSWRNLTILLHGIANMKHDSVDRSALHVVIGDHNIIIYRCTIPHMPHLLDTYRTDLGVGRYCSRSGINSQLPT